MSIVDRAVLEPGFYSANLYIASNGGTEQITVLLWVPYAGSLQR